MNMKSRENRDYWRQCASVIDLALTSRISPWPQPRHSGRQALCLEPFQERHQSLPSLAHLLLWGQLTRHLEMLGQGRPSFSRKSRDIGALAPLRGRRRKLHRLFHCMVHDFAKSNFISSFRYSVFSTLALPLFFLAIAPILIVRAQYLDDLVVQAKD